MKFEKLNRFAVGIGAIILVIIIAIISSYAVNRSGLKKLERQAEGYIAEEDYGPASTIYSRLYTKTGKEKYRIQRDETIALKNESKVYKQGLEKLDDGDYLSAIRIFGRIEREGSKYFDMAKEKLQDAESSILGEVKKALDDDNVYLASSILQDYLKLDKDSEEAKKLMSQVEKAVGDGETIADEDDEDSSGDKVVEVETEELPENPEDWIGKTVEVKAARSNLRGEPGLDGKVVGLAIEGDTITITKIKNDGDRIWCYGTVTNVRNGKKTEAWISGKLLR